jgi:class 3 adenylate cyclase
MAVSGAALTSVGLGEEGWLARIGGQRAQGNHLAAFDLARQALEIMPGAIRCEHQAILALARAGALAGALQRYESLVTSGRIDQIDDPILAADFAGLGGRLFKDLAERAPEGAARAYRLRSAHAYEAGHRRFGGYYLAVNAAAMFLAAGLVQPAQDYALIALELSERSDSYWAKATAAEATLILGDFSAARHHLQEAGTLCAGNLDELATTRRQMRWIIDLMAAPRDLLYELPAPLVLNWTINSSQADEAARFAFDADGKDVLAFGPLLRPGDLLVARDLLDRGAHVHLTLPASPELVRHQILMGRPERAEIFDTVLQHENLGTMLVTAEGAPFEPAARGLCLRQARGLALLRARSLEVTPRLLQISADSWHLAPMPAECEDLPGSHGFPDCPPEMRRQAHAILFGDVRGFSKLDEAEQLRFLEHVIGGFADVLDAVPTREYAETAGDGIFIVLSDIEAAVECCFALRNVLPNSVAASGLPQDLGIRLSAHIGPLYQRLDRVIGREKFCGMEVIRTARIEPVTPVGEIFVTEQFAAILACSAINTFICEYVGLQPMAKGFGECRMYSLRQLRNSSDGAIQPCPAGVP